MSLISHLNSLKSKHKNIERDLKIANDNHYDEVEITHLKKRKLKLKEEISKIENNLEDLA